MGSGKTTLGKKLAAKLKYSFVDLDEVVCTTNGFGSIKELVAAKGFPDFRKLEAVALRELERENKVVSTGGGTPCFHDNMDWMLKSGTVVFVDVDEKTIYNRLKETDRNERPLLAGLDDDELRQFIYGNLQERMPFYKRAQVSFNPLKQKLEELVSQLA